MKIEINENTSKVLIAVITGTVLIFAFKFASEVGIAKAHALQQIEAEEG